MKLNHKKVLLRERKRHTARHIESARYARGVPHPVMVVGYPSSHGGGVPHPLMRISPTIQTWPGGYPIQSWWGWVPHPVMMGVGTPSSHGKGVPQVPSRHPDLGWGTSHHQTWDGVPPTIRPGMGYPHCINITFPRTTYAGGNNVRHLKPFVACYLQVLFKNSLISLKQSVCNLPG